MRRVVVVGASLAGVHAARALREAGYDGELTLVGEEARLPYDRPPLSKEALNEGAEFARLELHPASWYADHGVRLELGRRAVGLDPRDRTVHLDGGTGLRYDRLLIATGATPRRLPGVPALRGVHVLRTLDDCLALRAELVAGRRLVVAGAGFIGLEVAATARAMGLQVSVVELAETPLAHVLGEEVGGWLAEVHQAGGVALHCGVGVAGVDGDPERPGGTGDPGDPDGAGSGAGRPDPRSGARPRGLRVRLTDGRVLPADLVVAGIGVTPNVGWLRDSGIALGDGVLCDAYCRTSAPGVAAAGDVARWYNPLFDERMRVEHWTNAVEQGRVAAFALLDAGVPAYTPVPYFWSDQFDARIRFVGSAFAAEAVRVIDRDERSLVVAYARDGVVRGALTVNAPRALAVWRRHIAEQTPWPEILASASA